MLLSSVQMLALVAVFPALLNTLARQAHYESYSSLHRVRFDKSLSKYCVKQSLSRPHSASKPSRLFLDLQRVHRLSKALEPIVLERKDSSQPEITIVFLLIFSIFKALKYTLSSSTTIVGFHSEPPEFFRNYRRAHAYKGWEMQELLSCPFKLGLTQIMNANERVIRGLKITEQDNSKSVKALSCRRQQLQ
jgi:hypothetical protein